MANSVKALRSWVVTWNNPTDEQRELLADALVLLAGVRYCGGQYEVGESGTHHWQGVVQFQREKAFSAVAGILPGAHLEPMGGSFEQAKHYASKPHEGCSCVHCRKARTLPNDGREEDAVFEEVGEPLKQGERSDIAAVMARVKEGAGDREIAEEFPGSWVRYHRAFERYRAILSPTERDWITHTTVLWGPPGTGKTRRAHELAGPGAYWVTYGTNAGAPQYYDGYDGHEVVVFDEFFGQIRRQEMCKLLDQYPCNVPTRGGQQPWLAKRVIITSNSEPADWWPRMGLGPVERRISGQRGVVHHMPNVYVDPGDPVRLAPVFDRQETQCAGCEQPMSGCQCELIAAVADNRRRRAGF